MKNKILPIILFAFVAFNFSAQAQDKIILEKPHVDKRVELMSIVFRLAERPEYSSDLFKLYTGRIEQYFADYKEHELIMFAKSIAENRGIGYDAPISMAIYLDEDLNLIKSVRQNIWERDTRWTKEDVEKFIPLLQKFAKDTRFDNFFNNNSDLYAKSISLYTPLYEPLDFDWYPSFFGKGALDTFSIILALGTDGGGYGPSLDYADGKRKVYTLIGLNMVDDTGMPKFDYNPLAFLTPIHEFGHSFVNNLIDKNKDALRESGEKLFSIVKEVLVKQAYGRWEIMMYEALVRATVLKYMKDHDFHPQMVEGITQYEKQCGFLWMDELVEELDSYANQRDKYPTLDSYMPRLIEAYKIWAKNINP